MIVIRREKSFYFDNNYTKILRWEDDDTIFLKIVTPRAKLIVRYRKRKFHRKPKVEYARIITS